MNFGKLIREFKMSNFNKEILCLIQKSYQDLIAKGEILPHSNEGRSFLKGPAKNSKDMNEAQLRQSFILPLVELLGWNKQNPLEVVAEERSNGGFLDIKLVYEGKTKFVIEIKRPSVDLEISSTSGKSAAYQGIGYSRSFSESPITIVTNFERTNIYHSYEIPSKNEVNKNLLATFLWSELDSAEVTEILDNLTKSNCRENKFKKYFDSLVSTKSVIKKSKPLNEKILKDFEQWRLELGQELYSDGLKNIDDVNNLVQKILDKIILIRAIEDRGLDSSSLANLKQLVSRKNIGKILSEDIFSHFEEHLSKEFFEQSSKEKELLKKVSDSVFKKIILKTYGEDENGIPDDIYDFSIIPIELLGFAYEQYLGKVLVLDEGKIKLELKPELKKSGGICYTPTFIVDYIVENAFNELDIKPGQTVKSLIQFKFLDPSCGSGSFLIRLFSSLIRVSHTVPNKKSERSKPPTLKEKKEILSKSIFGVDLDSRAVEITKLSLILKLLEGENQLMLIEGSIIPELSKNIRIGNSLIEPKDLGEVSDINEKIKIKPLEWNTFKREAGANEGFSAIIGNPPYVRSQVYVEMFPTESRILQSNYSSFSDGNADIYLPFMERSLSLLREKGVLSYILPHRFWSADYGANLRKLIQEKYKMLEVLNFRAEQVFSGVTTYTTVMTLSSLKPNAKYGFKYFEGDQGIEAEQLTKIVNDYKVRAERSLLKSKLITDNLSSEILLETEWLLAPEKIREKILNLEKNSTRLESYISEEGVFQGIITGGDDDFFISREDWGNKQLNKFLVKMLKGSEDIKAFTLPEYNKLLIYPYLLQKDSKCKLASLAEIKKESSEIEKILLKNEKSLRKRSSLKTASQRKTDLENFPNKFEKNEKGEPIWHYLENDYYKYSRNQALNAPKRKKILVPSLFKRPAFVPDDNGEYITSGSGSGGGGGIYFQFER